MPSQMDVAPWCYKWVVEWLDWISHVGLGIEHLMVLKITRLDWSGRMNFLSNLSISLSALARWPGCWFRSSSCSSSCGSSPSSITWSSITWSSSSPSSPSISWLSISSGDDEGNLQRSDWEWSCHSLQPEQFSVEQYIIIIHDDDDDDDRCNEYEVHDDVLSGKDFFLWQSKCESKRE